ncbi:MAG: hypothetical protein RL722_1336 [Pseudomonadota bacterium]|jgi:hypothetical protein
MAMVSRGPRPGQDHLGTEAPHGASQGILLLAAVALAALWLAVGLSILQDRRALSQEAQRLASTLVATAPALPPPVRGTESTAAPAPGLVVATALVPAEQALQDHQEHAADRATVWITLALLLSGVMSLLTWHVLRRARQQEALAEALRLSRQRDEIAQQLHNRLLLDLADGVREPLQTILNRSACLRDTQDDPAARGSARQIHDAAQALCDRFCTMFEPSASMPLDALAPPAAPSLGAGPSCRSHHQQGAEVVDVGIGRPGHHQVAQG